MTAPQPTDLRPILEEHLEEMAAMMAAALEQLECPDCCGPVWEFIETGASIHREELEWACFVQVIRQRR